MASGFDSTLIVVVMYIALINRYTVRKKIKEEVRWFHQALSEKKKCNALFLLILTLVIYKIRYLKLFDKFLVLLPI